MRRGKKVDVKNSTCFFCHGNCSVLAHVEDGRVVKIEGNPESPVSRGYTCVRLRHAIDWLYHPSQLKHARKRVGERGEGKWEQIGWSQAVDEIARKVRRLIETHGPECLAFSEGTYRSDQSWARARFANLMGNPQNTLAPGNMCYENLYTIDHAIFGAFIFPRADLRRATCLVVWGGNPAESETTGASWRRIKGALAEEPERKLIVVDPRLTETAKLATTWLQIRPGTDCALALAWLNVIINESLYDKEFVEKWCHGFDRLRDRVQSYPPSKVAGITGVPEEKITESARTFATNRPACMRWGVAVDQVGLNATSTRHALDSLIAITGNIDVRGGHLLYEPGEPGGFVRESDLELPEKCSLEQRKKQIGYDRFKLMTWQGYELLSEAHSKKWGQPLVCSMALRPPAPLLFRAMLTGRPYPIRALITWASNPLMWAANTKLVYEALKSPNLELHVVMDYWMTPTAELADYVLPAASWLERPHCNLPLGEGTDWIRGGVRAVEPLGERHTDYEFFRELGIRLGQDEGKYWPWKTCEELIEYRIKGLNITYEDWSRKPWTDAPRRGLKRYETWGGFATPTGKVELYCTTFEKLGYNPLPSYEEPPESPVRTPDVAKNYPLILITGMRFKPMYHSEHRQLGIGLREMHPDPVLEVHPETARTRGIRDGDWVWIETRRGKVQQRAKLCEEIHPKVVSIQHGWWFPEEPGEEPCLHGAFRSNANLLTLDEPESLDPLVGSWCNRALLCNIYK